MCYITNIGQYILYKILYSSNIGQSIPYKILYIVNVGPNMGPNIAIFGPIFGCSKRYI